MKNSERLIYGLTITIAIFLISIFSEMKFHCNIDFIPNSFVSNSLTLLLSIIAIYVFRKDVNYKISLPKFKDILKPVLFGFLSAIIINILITIIIQISGGTNVKLPAFKILSPLQSFVFVFIYASIAEEILCRGFLMNILKPLKIKGIKFLKINISMPVIISAFIFGLLHLALIMTGVVNAIFLLRMVVFTTILGLIAGYYQEKYDNNAFAIIVHMSSNLLAVIGTLLMSLKA